MNSSHSGVDGGYNCRVKLNQSLAIVVRKEGCRGDPGDFWMYENGYLLFQGLLSANSVCWWNNALNGATKSLVYHGYVNPGAILVSSEPCALEILRNAWSRRVLQPPTGYQIVAIEDIDECLASPVSQTQWTPLPEAVCAVVLRLSSQGRPAGIETIREGLILTFPHVSPPSEHALYDTLVQLTKERKLYNTSNGYYIVTPERRRSRSQSHGRKRDEHPVDPPTNKSMLMSAEEAMVKVHGDMTTIRDGNITHQCIQTNLADVICGGNASDKILYPKNKRRSSSFPSPRSPDRRSFRLWSSNRRLRRSASTRTIAKHHYGDTSSSTEYPNSSDSTPVPKKESLLSRLFRRSKRSQCQIGTFSAQFPPSEWFNSKAIHLHNVGTQTCPTEKEIGISISSYLENYDIGTSRSATLPRHRRQLSSDLTFLTSTGNSRENSPISRFNTSTLPRNKYRSRDSSRKTSRSSLSKTTTEKTEDSGIKSLDVTEISNSNTSSPKLNGRIDSTTLTNGESKTSHRFNSTTYSCDETTDNSADSPVKNLSSIDNSGPSSIESHKSNKTGSSVTSGPSSIESHKTVINRNVSTASPKTSVESRSLKKLHHRRETREKSKIIQKQIIAPVSTLIPHSNSFTLQVTTNQGNSNSSNKNNATTTATINGGATGNTKIFVQNSPIRSVITFENGQSTENNPNLVIINGADTKTSEVKLDTPPEICDPKSAKNTNQSKEPIGLNNSTSSFDNSINNEQKNEAMNNSRKLSLQLPSRDGLSYHNLIKNVSSVNHNQYNSNSNPDSPIANTYRDFSKNGTYNSNPPSPTKSYEGIPMAINGKYSKNEVRSPTSAIKKELLPEKTVISNSQV
ncbi:unnamed protein product [Brassicogethes aeneus]|uniref:Winged helix Storkhead-box1 domain-containing protein n=1 Tax=Brassicogethes aeneus TaxID=1431903 RepID=A0A9P0B5Y5_BRAAE|nr:unnamed protein product [Brassicogethes aeneus]